MLELNYLICSDCGGRGCLKCQNIGLGLFLGDKFLYWGKRIDSLAIFERKLERFIKYFINIFLFFFGIVSLMLPLWFIAVESSFFSGEPLYHLINLFNKTEPQRIILLFWFGLFTDLYLAYRLSRQTESKGKVIKGENMSFLLGDWPLVRKTKKVDISQSFTDDSLRIIEEAYLLSLKLGHKKTEAIHLLASLFFNHQIVNIFGRLALDFQQLKERITNALKNREKGENKFSLEFHQIFFKAYLSSMEMKEKQVEPSEMLEAILEESELIKEIFYDLKVDLISLKNVIAWIRVSRFLKKRLEKFRSLAVLKPKGVMDRAMTAVATPFLDRFSQDLTKLARAGYLEPCMNRNREIEEIFRVIEGGQQSVILVGQPGIGKRTIIEGIAQRMVEEDVPKILQDKRLVSLSISQLVSGATLSQAGERLLKISYEIARANNIVLVIPEIEEIAGISGEEGMDLSNILSEELSKGYFFALTFAQPEKYVKKIEKSNLGRALQKIIIEEPDFNQTIQILEAKSGYIEYQNNVFFSYPAIEEAVKSSNRFIHEQYLPEKAIEIMKEAAAFTRKKKGKKSIVTAEEIGKIISDKTKIPLSQITQKEADKLLHLEEIMHQRVIGQDQAVKMVAKALRRARTELREGKRPIANFLFLGPTGVGKTETAKTVAEAYFGDEKNMIRLDMSEYQDKLSLYRLIGNPGEGGLLTEPVRQNPFSLLLLDEIEKAHPDILNIFLSIMDDGRATDGLGKVIDFTNLILIATSNAATPFVQESIQQGKSIEEIKERLLKQELKNYFRPEFLNRFDGIIIFTPLTQEEIEKVARLLLFKITRQIEEKRGIMLKFTDAAIFDLARAGFDPLFGARPLRRVIQEQVSDRLAELLLKEKLNRRDLVIFDQNNQIRIEKAKQL